MATRRTSLTAGAVALALIGASGIGIAAARTPSDRTDASATDAPTRGSEAQLQHRDMTKRQRKLMHGRKRHMRPPEMRRMHREAMRNPGMCRHMQPSEMRRMHREMMMPRHG